MGQNAESPATVDLDSIKRNRSDLVDGVKLTEIKISDRPYWKTVVGEKLRFYECNYPY